MPRTENSKRRSHSTKSKGSSGHKKHKGTLAAVCINCQGEATRQCIACFAAVCKRCSVRHEGERYCSTICAEADGRTRVVVAAAHATDAAQELRMFLADPWDQQLYWRIFKWGSLVGVVALMWYGILMLGDSQPKRDIRDLAVQHGESLDGTRVGETNLTRTPSSSSPDKYEIDLPAHLRPARAPDEIETSEP